jgi:hypothetical protein
MIELPIDTYKNQITPQGLTLNRTVQALGDSFLLTLQANTTFIRVYAISKDIYLKWATADEDYCTAGNFDEVIPASQYVDFSIPTQTNGKKFTRITFVGREAGSTLIVIEK